MRWIVTLALCVVGAACRSTRSPSVSSSTPTMAPDPACATSGCLRSASKIGDYSAAQLRPVLDPRVTIDNGYAVWALEYFTRDRTSLATVTIPDATPPPAGFGIVANNHGTTGIDDACKYTSTVYGAGLAGSFGARGEISVATDYPGIGTPGIHPYLVSEVEGRAVLDALRAAANLARWRGVRISGHYGVVGLSQGGHATLAAAALHRAYAPELDVRAFAAAAPASVYEEQWRAGFVDGPLVPYVAMTFWAWADHYKWSGPSIWAPGMEAHVQAAMLGCVGSNGLPGTMATALGTTSRSKVFSAAFIDAFEKKSWGPFAAFGAAFAANRIVPFTQTAPLKIYQGDADTIVYEAGTRALVDDLGKGGVKVEYEVVAGATHFDLAFGFVASQEKRTDASIAWVRSKVDAP